MQGWVQDVFFFPEKWWKSLLEKIYKEKTCQIVFFGWKKLPHFFCWKNHPPKNPKKIVDSNEERNGFGEGRGTLRTWTVRPGKWSLDSQGLTGDGLSFWRSWEVEVGITGLPRDYTGLKCRCNFVCGKIDGFDVLDGCFYWKTSHFSKFVGFWMGALDAGFLILLLPHCQHIFAV